jgi:CheY-like chemotaxis protein
MLPLLTSQPIASSHAHLEILVADDVEEIRRLIAEWLRGAGHRVTLANNGAQVVRLMRQQHFDLIVTDVLMPDGDGLEVILAARRESRPPRILAISGGGSYMTGPDCLRVAKGVGAHATLMKPFNRAQLLAAVERLASEPDVSDKH